MAVGSADLRGLGLGHEPWLVLVGRNHKLYGCGPLAAGELEGEEVLVTAHRDGAGYDRAVADTLLGLGVRPAFRRGGPGPSLLAAVASGEALALTTAPGPLDTDVVARKLHPLRRLEFELLWRIETPSPALSELIRTAHDRSLTEDATPPALRAVA
jgi:DNA-binding transcriptional LysR family regulator